MDATFLDGSAAAITAALERKRKEIDDLIANRRGDRSFHEGLGEGVKQYRALAALHELHLSQLGREYTAGTRQHMRDVNKFLSSRESGDEFELRSMLNFVLGLLRLYVEMTEERAAGQLKSALSSLDIQDLASV